VNEYFARQLGQKPSVLPGRPLRLRPTAVPHDGQKRFSSATSATVITAERASAIGAAGTVVMPAPRRAWATRRAPAVRLVRVEPVRLVPIGVDPRRCDPVLVLAAPPAAADAADAAALGEPAAMPHTLQ
jgi:hypothetical protein